MMSRVSRSSRLLSRRNPDQRSLASISALDPPDSRSRPQGDGVVSRTPDSPGGPLGLTHAARGGFEWLSSLASAGGPGAEHMFVRGSAVRYEVQASLL